jgi:PAS domain S-box-containing protein
MENASSNEELIRLEERYRMLFDRNVAAIAITTPGGRMVDCNEAFTRILGFDSRAEVLARTAWDFYFNREDRNAVINESRVVENCIGEEICLRHKDGTPLWVRATRVVLSRVQDRPELLQGTLVDITRQKKTEERLREIEQVLGLSNEGCRVEMPQATQSEKKPRAAAVFGEVEHLLRHMNEALQPDKLKLLGRAEIRDFVIDVERLKVLVEELEVLHLTGQPDQ